MIPDEIQATMERVEKLLRQIAEVTERLHPSVLVEETDDDREEENDG